MTIHLTNFDHQLDQALVSIFRPWESAQRHDIDRQEQSLVFDRWPTTTSSIPTMSSENGRKLLRCEASIDLYSLMATHHKPCKCVHAQINEIYSCQRARCFPSRSRSYCSSLHPHLCSTDKLSSQRFQNQEKHKPLICETVCQHKVFATKR